MEWVDDGIVLGARRHGEAAVVVHLLTREHGRHAGLVPGGAGGRARGLYQPGNLVRAVWRARLSEHLGTFRCEPLTAFAAQALDRPLNLAGLAAAAAMAEATLPEREPHRPVFEGFLALLGALDDDGWPGLYVRWEMGLLAELGFGLDLSNCAATGAAEDLAYVSPKSGRAVSRAAGEPYRAVMLALPPFLLPGAVDAPDMAQVRAGLALTGYFLERHVLAPHGQRLAAARARFVDRIEQSSTISSA